METRFCLPSDWMPLGVLKGTVRPDYRIAVANSALVSFARAAVRGPTAGVTWPNPYS